MSTITLLYFAQASRLAGLEREQIPWRGGSVQELGDEVVRRHPALAELRSSWSFAVDEEMAGPGVSVLTGQTVAIMPPFSGG